MRRIFCTTKPPHNLHNEVVIGSLSILFSYGKVAGVSYAGTINVANDSGSTTQRQLNKWRDFRSHKRVTRRDLISSLLASLQQEASLLITADGERNMKRAGNETLLAGAPEEDDLEELDDAAGIDDDDLDDDDDEDEEDLDDDDDEDDDLGFDDDDDEDDDDLSLEDLEDDDPSDPDRTNKY